LSVVCRFGDAGNILIADPRASQGKVFHPPKFLPGISNAWNGPRTVHRETGISGDVGKATSTTRPWTGAIHEVD
jgi:hypothetical protein